MTAALSSQVVLAFAEEIRQSERTRAVRPAPRRRRRRLR
jgi:hypothetical protein